MVSKFFSRRSPEEKISEALEPLIERFREIETLTAGALVLDTTSSDSPSSISLKTPEAESFPTASEYYHTRETDGLKEDSAFTISASLNEKGDVVLAAISHDHSRTRTAEPAHAQIEERVPDFEGIADDVKGYVQEIERKVMDFAHRTLPESALVNLDAPAPKKMNSKPPISRSP